MTVVELYCEQTNKWPIKIQGNLNTIIVTVVFERTRSITVLQLNNYS